MEITMHTLNEEWQMFMEATRLRLLIDVSEEVNNFLHNLQFIQPSIKKRETLTDEKEDLSELIAWEVSVVCVHPQFSSLQSFRFGTFQVYDTRSHFLYGIPEIHTKKWLTNGEWISHFVVRDASFSLLPLLGENNYSAYQIISDLLDEFRLLEKLKKFIG